MGWCWRGRKKSEDRRSETTRIDGSMMAMSWMTVGAWRRRAGFRCRAGRPAETSSGIVVVGFPPRLAAGGWVGFDQTRKILPGGFASEVRPSGSVHEGATAAIKRMGPTSRSLRSVAPVGKLPPEGGENADVLIDSGEVPLNPCYTEYFAKGPSRRVLWLHPPAALSARSLRGNAATPTAPKLDGRSTGRRGVETPPKQR